MRRDRAFEPTATKRNALPLRLHLRPKGAQLQISREIEQTWRRQTLGALDILVHPEAAIERAGTSGLQCVLIGDLLGPSLAERLQSLSTNPTSDKDGLLGILDGMCGRFALLWDDGREVRIVADAVGSRTIYYTNAPFGIAASHAGLVSRAVRARPCDRVAKLIAAPEYKSLQVGYLPGDVTPHAGIYALPPNHHFGFQSGRATRFWPRARGRPTETADFAKFCTAYLERFRDDLVASRRTALFGLTGGIDSRTLISAWSAAGTPFESLTWIAPNLDPEERPIIDALARRLPQPHVYADLATFSLGRVAKIARSNTGEHRGHSRLAEAVNSLYGHRSEFVFVRGYGASVIRGFYNEPWRANAPLRDLSPAEMSRAYRGGLRGMSPGPQWRTLTEHLFEHYAERIGLESKPPFGYDPSDLFFWEHRLATMGAGMLNEMDVALPSLVGFNDRRLFDSAFGLPARDRFSKGLMLQVIQGLAPDLASVPVHKMRRWTLGSRVGRWRKIASQAIRRGTSR